MPNGTDHYPVPTLVEMAQEAERKIATLTQQLEEERKRNKELKAKLDKAVNKFLAQL